MEKVLVDPNDSKGISRKNDLGVTNVFFEVICRSNTLFTIDTFKYRSIKIKRENLCIYDKGL